MYDFPLTLPSIYVLSRNKKKISEPLPRLLSLQQSTQQRLRSDCTVAQAGIYLSC